MFNVHLVVLFISECILKKYNKFKIRKSGGLDGVYAQWC